MARHQRLDRRCREIVGADFCQRAAEAADRSAHGIADIYFSHSIFSLNAVFPEPWRGFKRRIPLRSIEASTASAAFAEGHLCPQARLISRPGIKRVENVACNRNPIGTSGKTL